MMTPMNMRGLITVILTGIAGPIGSVLAAVGFGQWAIAEQAGMASLAAVVFGLLAGQSVLAFLVFVVCLVTLLRRRVERPWASVGVMVGVTIVSFLVSMVALAAIARTGDINSIGTVVAALVLIGVLAVGAWTALLVGRVTTESVPE